MAPQTTGEALKGGRLVAEVLSRQGFPVVPAPGPTRVPSMITAVKLGSRERMVAFCKGIQDRCPVGSYITPEPGGVFMTDTTIVVVVPGHVLCVSAGQGRAAVSCLSCSLCRAHSCGVLWLICNQSIARGMVHNTDQLSWPAAGVTAGYGDEVIFADGTFIDGSTGELSADGPIRPPYVVYCQVSGGA
jgi:cystathionine beta-lyase family protein involved in aluminum resistance